MGVLRIGEIRMLMKCLVVESVEIWEEWMAEMLRARCTRLGCRIWAW